MNAVEVRTANGVLYRLTRPAIVSVVPMPQDDEDEEEVDHVDLIPEFPEGYDHADAQQPVWLSSLDSILDPARYQRPIPRNPIPSGPQNATSARPQNSAAPGPPSPVLSGPRDPSESFKLSSEPRGIEEVNAAQHLRELTSMIRETTGNQWVRR